jgi:hypothetical protein
MAVGYALGDRLDQRTQQQARHTALGLPRTSSSGDRLRMRRRRGDIAPDRASLAAPGVSVREHQRQWWCRGEPLTLSAPPPTVHRNLRMLLSACTRPLQEAAVRRRIMTWTSTEAGSALPAWSRRAPRRWSSQSRRLSPAGGARPWRAHDALTSRVPGSRPVALAGAGYRPPRMKVLPVNAIAAGP